MDEQKVNHAVCAHALAGLLALLPASHAAAADAPWQEPDGGLAILLQADFDDKPVGETIGTGGPEVGEPVLVDADVSAVVEQAGVNDNHVLALEADSLSTASGVRFELLGGIGLEHGPAAFRAALVFPDLCGFNLYVREPGSSAQSFTTIQFNPSGSIVASDAAGVAGQIGTYSAGQVLRLSIEFDLDAGTYDVLLNGNLLLDDRAHGVVGYGVGRFMMKFEYAQPPTRVLLDNIRVEAPPPDRLFDDGFEQP